MKKKEDEMNSVLDGERSRASEANAEKQEWADLRLSLEDKLAEAQSLNDSMKLELERVREDHEVETQQLRDQVADLQENARSMDTGSADADLQRENEELRNSLQEQQQVTEEVRQEAREFLREMKELSQQSGSTWERHAELEKTIEQLEHEVRDWRNRYARTRTQLRNMRASSMGLAIDQDAGKFVRDKGFVEDNGLVKDVHVTKFQIAIDELLLKARQDNPDKVVDAMKSVVVSVRRITKSIDASTSNDEEVLQQRAKLKSKVSSTANSLITAAKHFSAAAGISPVSLLDAAASHLTAAVVELLQTVKIRATPVGELEDDDDGTVTPVDSTGFFSPRSTTQVSTPQGMLPPPPPFQGLGGMRASADSSAYSPVHSPRQSADPYRDMTNGSGASDGYGMPQRDSRVEALKVSIIEPPVKVHV